MRERCLYCGLVFEREQGYFIGAIYINVLVTELMIGLAFLVCFLTLSATGDATYGILFAVAIIVPMIFYRHARSLWLSFDFIIDPPEGSQDSATPHPEAR